MNHCSFCSKDEGQVGILVPGVNGALICRQCVRNIVETDALHGKGVPHVLVPRVAEVEGMPVAVFFNDHVGGSAREMTVNAFVEAFIRYSLERREIAQAQDLARELGLKYLDIDKVTVGKDLRVLVPRHLCDEYAVVPLWVTPATKPGRPAQLYLAAANPRACANLSVADVELHYRVATPSAIARAIVRHYGEEEFDVQIEVDSDPEEGGSP